MPTQVKTPAVDFQFVRSREEGRDWADNHAAKSITGIAETTRDAIREIIAQAFEEGNTVDEVAEEIDSFLDDPARAETIARTETLTAANAGQQEAWDQAVDQGLLTGDEKQEWIVTSDDRLCDICAPLEGQQVALDEPFSVDGDNIDGPPAHPNCRCTVGLAL